MVSAAKKNDIRTFFSRLITRAERDAAHLPDMQLRAEKAAQSIFNADHNQHKTGTGEKFWQYREYIFGDRPQDIDWRQSAKGDRIYIRQKEWQTTLHWEPHIRTNIYLGLHPLKALCCILFEGYQPLLYLLLQMYFLYLRPSV